MGWTNDVFVNPAKGGVVTEGGSRWYQGYTTDAGSVKIVMTWLYALRTAFYAGKVPFVPGGIISWEVNVGNSHTRWHWSTPDNSPEPTIPWDAHIHVDQTPISYTEAGLIQQYTKNTRPFYTVSTFMPDSFLNTQDYFLIVPRNATRPVSDVNTADGIYELTFWPNATSVFSLWMHATPTLSTGYRVTVDLPMAKVSLTKVTDGTEKTLSEWSYNKTTLECGVITNGWNLLRVIAQMGEIDVYLNPMYTDAASPDGIQPRFSTVDSSALAAGRAVVASMGGVTLVDYFSISKLDAYGAFVKLPSSRRAVTRE